MTARAYPDRSWPRVLALLALSALAFWSAGRLNRRLIETTPGPDLHADPALEDASPLIAFTAVGLGGFRGLLADLLWLRIADLQERGEYFEVFQLADWIARLEPRAADVWSYHAWNMAYNVSVMMADPNERWRWVVNGLNLLRGDGLRWNPDDPRLLCELGWLFQIKIAGRTDDAHAVYRQRWAETMRAALGGPRPDYEALAADSDRARQLREAHGLDVAIMRTVDEAYGPLDWERPETHALYWGFRAIRKPGAPMSLAADRLVYQSLAALCRGEIAPDGTPRRPAEMQDALLPGALRAFRETLRRHPGEPNVTTAFAGFLRAAARDLDHRGRADEVVKLYATLLAEARPDSPPASLREWLAPLPEERP